MKELRYQLDLLKAMNRKLAEKERMYRMGCDTSADAFLYCSFEQNQVEALGQWRDFFDFDIRERKEIARLYDAVDDSCLSSLQEVLFPEKTKEKVLSAECLLKNKDKWLQFRTKISYDEEGNPRDKVVCISDITKFKKQNEELTYMAYYDELTGLYNRNYFESRLEEFVR